MIGGTKCGESMSNNRAVYLMARLTTKGLAPGAVFGGIPELSRTDIAAACTGLNSLSFHLVLAKYCDDAHSALRAMGELQALMCSRAPLWADMEPARRSSMAAAMIDEFVGSSRCRRCKGTGEQIENKKIIECKACGGIGRRSRSAFARARAAGIPDQTFRDQQLNGPFDEIMRDIEDIEARTLSRIARKAS